MSLLILSGFQLIWLKFCLIGVTFLILSDSAYPNPCFAFQVCKNTCTKHTARVSPTMLRAAKLCDICTDRLVKIATTPFSSFQIQRKKSTTFTVRRWWHYCPARHPSVHILIQDILGKRVQRCRSLRVLRCVRSWWYASHTKHCTVWVVAARMFLYLWLETQWRRATRWSFLCEKTIRGKYITCRFY